MLWMFRAKAWRNAVSSHVKEMLASAAVQHDVSPSTQTYTIRSPVMLAWLPLLAPASLIAVTAVVPERPGGSGIVASTTQGICQAWCAWSIRQPALTS
jgi:hypothetical protein